MASNGTSTETSADCSIFKFNQNCNFENLKSNQPVESDVMTKRKKDFDNQNNDLAVNKRACLEYEWSDTAESVYIDITLSAYKTVDLKKISTLISTRDIRVILPDKREWRCSLYSAIKVEKSQVSVEKAGKVKIHLVKDHDIKWPHLEAADPTLSASGDERQSEGDHNHKEVALPSEVLPSSHVNNVYHLTHINHDFIEYDTTLSLKILVKSTPESLNIVFEERLLTVQFQSKDNTYLALHHSANEDTTFVWKINLKGEIIPAKCVFHTAPSVIRIMLQKQVHQRWGSLEASTSKKSLEKQATKKNEWLPICDMKPVDNGSEKQDPVKEFDKKEDAGSKESKKSSPSPEKQHDSLNKKPTCTVTPLSLRVPPSPLGSQSNRDAGISRGYTGLDNLGNTCFMNSVLQALVNTRDFRDYFLGSHYQRDLNTDNPLGSGGHLAVEFALLNKYLWAALHYSYAPSKLKSLVAMKASQFTGYAQHDAQEFMAFLLDGLHEDLNRVKKKPYTPTSVNTDGQPDYMIADKLWQLYKRRNDSFVVDLFQGQYKSKLVCPVCNKVSITFDPFLYLQVPLPKKRRLFPVILMFKDPLRKPLKMMVRLPKEAGVDELKEVVSKKTGIRPCDMRIFEAYKGKIHKVFGKNSDLSSVQITDNIFVCEVLSEEAAGEPVYEIAVIQRTVLPNEFPMNCSNCKKSCTEGTKLRRCTKCYKVGYCDKSCQSSHWSDHKTECTNTPGLVGCPFIISLPESKTTFSVLCQMMEAFARFSVDVFQPPVKTEKPSKLNIQPQCPSSSLSSSHSLGSQSSLDSTSSSASSTCTLTADLDISTDPAPTSPLPCDDDLDDSCTSSSLLVNVGSPSPSNLSVETDDQMVSSPGDSIYSGGCGDCMDCHAERCSCDYFYSGQQSSEFNLGKSEHSGAKPLEANDKTSPALRRSSATNVTYGIQRCETNVEKCTPAFYIKPVNRFGEGLKGDLGGVFQDKGDEPLKLNETQFFSMDWKNNHNLSPYVLVQSKELDCEEDESMHTEYVEENGNMKLHQCLTLFTEPEILSPDESWYCPQCRTHREASKQMSIWRLPATLIIQLKRFSFSNFIWRDKIEKMVEFPTRGLNLMNYYVGPDQDDPPIYDLYAVINHQGGILGGHYTAFVRCPDQSDSRLDDIGWRLCADSRVTKCQESNVVTQSAYVLFYRRRFMTLPIVDSGLSTGTDDDDDEEPEVVPTLAVPETLSDSDLFSDMDAID